MQNSVQLLLAKLTVTPKPCRNTFPLEIHLLVKINEQVTTDLDPPKEMSQTWYKVASIVTTY
jgi:hypothetical protein